MSYTIFDLDTGYTLRCSQEQLWLLKFANYQVWRGRSLVYQVGG